MTNKAINGAKVCPDFQPTHSSLNLINFPFQSHCPLQIDLPSMVIGTVGQKLVEAICCSPPDPQEIERLITEVFVDPSKQKKRATCFSQGQAMIKNYSELAPSPAKPKRNQKTGAYHPLSNMSRMRT